MRRLTAFLDGTARALEVVLALLFLALFLVTMLNIVLRNVGGVAWMWIPAFSRLTFVWIVFLGLALAYRRGDHLVVDVLLARLRGRARRAATLLIHAALIPFALMLLVYGRDVAAVRMRVRFDTWHWPTGWAYAAVPVAAAILLAFVVERLVITWQERSKP
jgi:TRAP-type transport system small permease protein